MTKSNKTNNMITKGKRTNNTITKRKRTNNTIAKRKRTNNTITKRKRTNNRYLRHMYTWPFTVLVWYMYINNNNNKKYHRNRETIDISDTCIQDRSLYWSDTCTLIIIIIIKDIIETEKQSIPLTHVYMTVHCTGLVHVN
jgi:hypothetical protein